MKLGAVWFLALWSYAAAAIALAQIDVADTRLEPAAVGTRQIFFNDIYRLTIALPQGRGSLSSAMARDIPKALLVDVTYDGSVPRNVPDMWQEELLPALPEQDEALLRDAYAGLQSGDQITVTYAPQQGTILYVNDREVLADPGYGLMGAFMDLWLGKTPASEDLRDSLRSDLSVPVHE